VNVTLVPTQIAPAGTAATLTLTGKLGLTVIVTVLDVAGFPVGHVALDINTQVTKSPLAKVVLL
jgi:hypothetical protein